TGVDGHVPAEHRRGTVAGIVVLEGADAVPHAAELLAGGADVPGVDVVLAADGEGDAVPRGHDDAGRPDLDVELVDLARVQGLDLVVGVVRPVGPRQIRVH